MKFLLLSVFVVAAFAEKTSFKESFPDVPQELIGVFLFLKVMNLKHSDLIPPEVRTMMEGMTDEDKAALEEAAKMLDEEKVRYF